MDKVEGSMEVLGAMQVTADTEGLDAECKALLRNKEVLAVILKETMEEYKEYYLEEIMGFIESDSIKEIQEVSESRTNTVIRGDSAEFAALNEKVSFFDVLFRAKNPLLSGKDFVVNLHVNIEPQKSYRPGYPIEKRGLYYLARRLSAQLSLVTDKTDYGSLEKCCSIWICRDDVPEAERYSMSVYEMVNTKNIGECVTPKNNYDLMKLVVIRLGSKVYNGDKGSEGYRLLHFLNLLMYPHRSDFIESISEYIDFSGNEELWKERKRMFSLGQCVYEDGKEDGKEEGRKEGREEGREEGIRALILDNQEEQIPRERIILKLRKHFSLTKEKAEQYYQEFSRETQKV